MPYKYNVFTKKLDYYQAQEAIIDWQESVLSKTTEYGAAVASGTNRYICPTTSGLWTADNVYQFNGTDWDETAANEGMACYVEDVDIIYIYSNSNWVTMASIVDHGALAGLSDDDHTQYILADGTRAFSGTVSGVAPTEDAHLTRKDYVDDLVTTSSGDILTYVSDNYVDNTEMTTISGDILVVAAADVDSDITTHISADDHTQYLRTDGTRALTGTWNYGSDTISGTGDIYAADFFAGKIIETIKSHGVVSSGTEIFDLNEGTYHITTISGNFTAAFSGWSSTGVTSMTMKLTNAGAHTITWDAAVKWEGGIEPFWTNSGTDFGVFFSDDNGSSIYGIRSATDMG